MTFKEEALKSRIELKKLRQENACLKNANKKLHEKIARLEKENHELKKGNRLLRQEVKILKETIAQQQKQIESLKLIVEELRSMLFGKKKKKNGTGESETQETEISTDKSSNTKKRKSADRSKSSYRRAKPSEEDITDTYEHPITHCPDCGALLIRLKQIIRYIEDIADLPSLAKLLKKIEKHIIGSGYCPKCKKRKTVKDISPQVSILGENVKKFITYLIVVMRQSFEQVHCLLQDAANFQISDGEITLSLDNYARKLLSEEKRIRTRIRAGPGRHYDETGWPVQRGGEGNYCWATTPTIGEDTVFLMGRSRGKGNALELRGEEDDQAGITDDYAAYDNLFKYHQLCMSHPHRKLRDLHESKTLSGVRLASCTYSFEEFGKLYTDLEETLKTPFEQNIWLQKREEYIKRMRTIAVITDNDPDKLKKIKRALDEKAEFYFTCLLKPGIPADNNKEERKIRHIVLKRKISQGSKSPKGADTMSILCTTLLSCWWNKPKNFFAAYNQMLKS